MSNPISEDCSSGLHDYCTPCECECHKNCGCKMIARPEDMSMREWIKSTMCMFHWMQTDYYQIKVGLEKNILTGQLLDLITLMPDSQTQEIVDYIMDLRKIRKING